MRIIRNYTTSTTNLVNKQQVPFNGNHLSNYCGNEAARLIAQNKNLLETRPDIKIDSLKGILSALRHPIKFLKAFIIDRKLINNEVRANMLMDAGKRYANIDKKLKKTGFIA